MILYHGTNINVNKLDTPLWVTNDYHLAGHFALHAQSNKISTMCGYIYKVSVDDEFLIMKDKRRYIINGGDIKILEKRKVIYDRLTGFKKAD